MDTITGKIIGNINITIVETSEGDSLFNLQADNENVLPVLYVIEDTLTKY